MLNFPPYFLAFQLGTLFFFFPRCWESNLRARPVPLNYISSTETLYFSFKKRFNSATQVGLVLVAILLSQSLKYWDYKRAPSYTAPKLFIFISIFLIPPSLPSVCYLWNNYHKYGMQLGLSFGSCYFSEREKLFQTSLA